MRSLFAYVKTDGGTLNVRSAPTLSGSVLAELSSGSIQPVLGGIDSAVLADGFHWVRYNTAMRGWIAAEYLVFEKDQAYVNAPRDGFLNVRSSPNGAVVDKLSTVPVGEVINVINASELLIPIFSGTLRVDGVDWIEVGLNRIVASEFLVYLKYRANVRADGGQLNVRAQPNGEIIKTIPDESLIYVFSDPIAAGTSEWVAVGSGCYVSLRYLVKVEEDLSPDSVG
jgi:hypothetical protein